MPGHINQKKCDRVLKLKCRVAERVVSVFGSETSDKICTGNFYGMRNYEEKKLTLHCSQSVYSGVSKEQPEFSHQSVKKKRALYFFDLKRLQRIKFCQSWPKKQKKKT